MQKFSHSILSGISKKLLAFLGIFFFSLALSGSAVHAVGDDFLIGDNEKGFVAPDCNELDPTLCDPADEGSIRTTVLRIVNYALSFVGLIAVIAIIYYGFLWITSGGEQDQFEKGRKGVTYVAAGIILILLSYAIVNFLISAGQGVVPGDHSGGQGNPPSSPSSQNNPPNNNTPPQNTSPISTTQFQEIQNILDRLLSDQEFTASDIQNLRQTLTNLLNSIPDTPQTRTIRKTIQNIIHSLDGKTSLTDAERKDISNQISSVVSQLENFPKMTAIIEATPYSGNAPLTVSLDGTNSTDPTQTTIPAQNYAWSFYDENGTLQDLGGGPIKKVTFQNPGAYIVKLEVNSVSENPVISGVATAKIKVAPTQTTPLFTIDGEAVGSIARVSLTSAQKGLVFDPTPSTAAEGTEIAEYLWNFDGEKESFLKPTPTKRLFSNAGKYAVGLTLVENTGKTFRKDIILEVASSLAVIRISNKNPVVGETVFFDGYESTLNSNSDLLSFAWKITGPDDFSKEFIDGRPSVQFPTPGKYEVSLSASDALGNKAEAIDEVVVESREPTAIFSARELDESHPGTFRFNASGSRDPENEPLLFSWDFDGNGVFDIEGSSEPIQEFDFSEARSYRPRLRVTDPSGKWDETTRDILVKSVLNVDFTASSFVIQRGEEIRFNAIARDGQAFYWDFGDDSKESANQESVAHSFAEEGQYSVTLTAFNASDKKNSVTKTIYVGDGASPVPVVRVSINDLDVLPTKNLCGEGKSGVVLFRQEILNLSAEDSVNIDGGHGNLKFTWDYHDNTYEEGTTIKHRYSEVSQEGTCEQITLTAKDEITGIMRSAQPFFVFVKNATPVMTKLVVNSPAEICKAPCRVGLSLEGAEDPDGAIKTFRWWAVAEGDTKKIDFHTTTDPQTTLVIPPHGVQNSQFSVSFVAEAIDADGAKASSEEILGPSDSIIVKNGENPAPTVDFFVDRIFLKTGENVSFTAVASDPLGTPLPKNAYAWDFDGDGTFDDTTSGASVSRTYLKAGDYPVRLRVTARGVSASKTRTIFVSVKKEFPEARFSFQKREGSLLLNAGDSQKSTEIPGNFLSYYWDFDPLTDSDGNEIPNDDHDATGQTASLAFTGNAPIRIRLIVENSLGEQDFLERTISPEAVAEAGKATFRRSLRISSNVPMATLEFAAPHAVLQSGDSLDLFAFGFEPDGSTMEGRASFEILDAKGGTLDPERDFFSLGEAQTSVTAGDILGKLTVRVRANSFLGELFEDISFRVDK